MKHFRIPAVWSKHFRYHMGWNPIRIPSSFIIQHLATTRKST